LSECKRDASDGTVEALEKIVPAIRKRFANKVRIVVRADRGFAREKIINWCEHQGVLYCLDLASNGRLAGKLRTAFGQIKEHIKSGQCSCPVSEFVEIDYRTLKTWSRSRRVVGKAEVLKNTELAHASITTIRLKLFKIAARVRASCRRIHIELPSAYPYKPIFAQAHENLRALEAGLGEL
jgi:hypothetical protein